MSKIIEQLKKLYSRFENNKKSYIDPKHDWNILLAVTLSIVILTAILAFYFYTRIDQNKLFVTTPDYSSKDVSIKNSLFQKIISDINQRKSLFDAVKQNRGAIQDPSL